jgi:nucleoid-associated protein YgaU
VQFAQTPRESSDKTKRVVVVRGQRISDVAGQEYGDPTQWRPIAEASLIDNPRFLDAGTVLSVPSLSGTVTPGSGSNA